MRTQLLVVILLLTLSTAKCAKILGVFPAPGYSQFILCEKLMGELARKGHQVTVISTFKPKYEIDNYRTISVEEILTHFKGIDLYQRENAMFFTNILAIHNMGYVLSENTLKHDNVQNLLHSNERFDLVIVEQFFNEALMGFAKHFNAPLVLFCSIGPSEWNNHLMGNPSLPSIMPISSSYFSSHMNIMQRSKNTIDAIFSYLYRTFVSYPHHAYLMQKYFPAKIQFDDIIYNASLMLLNSHVTTCDNSPLIHGMVPIGGFHVDTNKLPNHLDDFLNSAENGAIFFSMGTNLKSSALTKRQQRNILKVFSKLEQKVLWKYEDVLSDVPENVLISKWMPQSDILAHRNARLFISHGGLLSTTEAVFHGIPMIGIPIFGDQKLNIARAVRNGFAVKLNFQDLNEDTLFAAIQEIINNNKYQQNARTLSNLMRDQLVTPRELAVFWIEHVLRHNGLHIKPPDLDLMWFQFYMIDILCFIIIFGLSLYLIIKILTRFICRNRNLGKNMKSKQKKNQ